MRASMRASQPPPAREKAPGGPWPPLPRSAVHVRQPQHRRGLAPQADLGAARPRFITITLDRYSHLFPSVEEALARAARRDVRRRADDRARQQRYGPVISGPKVSPGAYTHAVEALLREWPSRVRAPWVAYVPAHQGYVVMTLCRALYALATGEQTTKEEAAAWAAVRYPEWSSFINEARARYRADVHDSHHALISFTDHAVAEADGLIR
jgi:aminoglycoside adenylyltransferase-like protein